MVLLHDYLWTVWVIELVTSYLHAGVLDPCRRPATNYEKQGDLRRGTS